MSWDYFREDLHPSLVRLPADATLVITGPTRGQFLRACHVGETLVCDTDPRTMKIDELTADNDFRPGTGDLWIYPPVDIADAQAVEALIEASMRVFQLGWGVKNPFHMTCWAHDADGGELAPPMGLLRRVPVKLPDRGV